MPWQYCLPWAKLHKCEEGQLPLPSPETKLRNGGSAPLIPSKVMKFRLVLWLSGFPFCYVTQAARELSIFFQRPRPKKGGREICNLQFIKWSSSSNEENEGGRRDFLSLPSHPTCPCKIHPILTIVQPICTA